MLKLIDIFNSLVCEADYSVHKGSLGHGGRQYGGGTDSLYRMDGGRHTGHFGSGTYFSTYESEDSDTWSMLRKFDSDRPMVKVAEGLYIADLDRFNLYKVKSSAQADYLFVTLKMINRFFYSYAVYGKVDDGMKSALLDIRKRVSRLGLTVPDKFLRLVDGYVDFYSKNRFAGHKDYVNPTLSTLFMEMNGFNGVNVNGIRGYDNTLHGSVVYDLDKIVDTSKTTPEYSSYVDHDSDERDLSTMIAKLDKYGLYVLDLSSLDAKGVNLLLRGSGKIIDVASLQYMVNDGKLRSEQMDHILRVYPNIMAGRLSDVDISDIPFATLMLLLRRGVGNFDMGGLLYIISRNSYKVYDPGLKSFIKDFVSGLISKGGLGDDQLEMVEDILDSVG